MTIMRTVATLGVAAILAFGGASLAKAEEFVCSAMRGQLVHSDGSPVAGVEISREWTWRGKTDRDMARTDAAGHFAFSAVPAKRGLLGFLPAEDAVVQRYVAKLPEGPFEFLFISRSELSENGEAEGRPFNVRCRVDVVPGFDGFAWGTCELRN